MLAVNANGKSAIRDDGKYIWIKTDAVVDSGSVEVIGPKGIVDDNKIRETELSKTGKGYNAANRRKIKNMGEGPVVAESETGTTINFTAQLGDKVSKLLLGLSRAADAGNAALFNVDMDLIRKLAKLGSIPENLLVNKKTMVREEIKRTDGIYVHPMWIRREKPNTNLNLKSGHESFREATAGISGAIYFTADTVEGNDSQNPFEDLF